MGFPALILSLAILMPMPERTPIRCRRGERRKPEWIREPELNAIRPIAAALTCAALAACPIVILAETSSAPVTRSTKPCVRGWLGSSTANTPTPRLQGTDWRFSSSRQFAPTPVSIDAPFPGAQGPLAAAVADRAALARSVSISLPAADTPTTPGQSQAVEPAAAVPVTPPFVLNSHPTWRPEDLPLTRPANTPLDGSAEAGIDERTRFVPPARPDVPQPIKPPPSTPENVDTGRGFLDWQRATDDWGGLRPQLEDRGISLNAQLTADWSGAIAGGANPRNSAYRQLLNVDITLDTERLAGFKGGTFFAQFQHNVGRNGTDVVGDAQVYSNIDADGRTQIAEVSYQHVFGDETVRVKVGKLDANGDFAAPEYGGEFINSSFGVSPTIPMPTYPDAAAGAVVFVKPIANLYVGAGLYDGSLANGINTGENSVVSFLGSPAGVFIISEAGLTWAAGPRELAGRLALGGWHHTADFEGFDGRLHSGTSGMYVVAEQQVYKVDPANVDDARGVGVFLQYGQTDGDISAIEWHLGGGVAWTGPFDGRDDDVVGLGATYVAFGNDPAVTKPGELAVELFYKWQATKFFSIKPDLQYIHNPGGVSGRDAAFVGTVRMTLTF
jgi:porin